MQAKSEAAVALEAIYKCLCASKVKTELEFYPNSTPGFIKDQFGLRHYRDGSFTTTWGSTASESGDTAKRLGFSRNFGTPGRPQTASVHMGRF